MWAKIAERTGKSIDEVRQSTSATGFWRWQAVFEGELNERRPEFFYLAQLASEIACLPFLVWGKEPPEGLRDLEKWLLKFGDPESIKKRAEEQSEERAKQDAEFSRQQWLRWAGLDEHGNPTGPIKTRQAPRSSPYDPGTPPETADFGPSRADPGPIRVEPHTPPPKPPHGAGKRKGGVRLYGRNG